MRKKERKKKKRASIGPSEKKKSGNQKIKNLKTISSASSPPRRLE
jgi:hypothetical protein